ncbi:MAG: NUDIX hydrolase [Gemmobacter sp.]
MTTEVRPAATVILWRGSPGSPEVLMGQRGAGAAFMASKFVFPGGAVDPDDHLATPPLPLAEPCRRRLGLEASGGPPPDALACAAARELLEETGFSLRVSDIGAPSLRFVFRAITPPGRSRRFDARFLLAPATAIAGNPDDFSEASDELSHLHWIGLDRARALDLPFITEVVLAEVGALLRGQGGEGVPFFDNRTDRPTFRRLV